MKRSPLDEELLREAKRMEFPDHVIAKITGHTEREIHDMRHKYGITAAYKMVDTCAAEFAAETPYYYSVYGSENEAVKTNDRKKVLVLDPVRSGSVRELNLISAPYTVLGRFPRKDTRRLL